MWKNPAWSRLDFFTAGLAGRFLRPGYIQLGSREQLAQVAGFHIWRRQKHEHGKNMCKEPVDYEKSGAFYPAPGQGQL